MEQLLVATTILALFTSLILSRSSPAMLFSVAMVVCVLIGSIDIQTVMLKATNGSLVTLLFKNDNRIMLKNNEFYSYDKSCKGVNIKAIDKETFNRKLSRQLSFEGVLGELSISLLQSFSILS